MATEKIPPGYNEDNEIGRKKGDGGSEYDTDSSYGSKHPEERAEAPQDAALEDDDTKIISENDKPFPKHGEGNDSSSV